MRTGLLALPPVADVLDPQRPVDRLARYPAGFPSPIDKRPIALDRRFALNQELDEPIGVFTIGIEVMAELRPREDAAVKTHERDPFRVGSGPAERFQFAISSP